MLWKCNDKFKFIGKSIGIGSIITLVLFGMAPKAEAVTQNPCGVVAAGQTCLDFEGITGVNVDGIAPISFASGTDIPSHWTVDGDSGGIDGWWVSNDVNTPQDTGWEENMYLFNPYYLPGPLTIDFGGDTLDIISIDLIRLNSFISQDITLSGVGLGGTVSQMLSLGTDAGTSRYSGTDLGLLGTAGITSLTFSDIAPFTEIPFAMDNLVFAQHVSAVPEPASIVLMAAGMAAIIAYRKRKEDN